MNFGERLRELRLQNRFSQRKLAEKVDIDFTYLSKIERGRLSPPSEETIRKLAKALDADEDELMTLANRVPEDVKDVVTQSKKLPAFLRQLKGLDDDDIEELHQRAKKLTERRRDSSRGSQNDG